MLKSRKRSERGAAMVEFAIVMPLFVLLLFGIMEAGWMFSQQVEVRHAAREGARIAAVSNPPLPASFAAVDIRDRVCSTMNLSVGSVTVIDVSASGNDIGDSANVSVTTEYQTLTGLLDPIFNGLSISTSVDIRLEQPRAWSNMMYTAVSPASVCP